VISLFFLLWFRCDFRYVFCCIFCCHSRVGGNPFLTLPLLHDINGFPPTREWQRRDSRNESAETAGIRAQRQREWQMKEWQIREYQIATCY
jgi:hypothetical protein